jgi:hypothetical protein
MPAAVAVSRQTNTPDVIAMTDVVSNSYDCTCIRCSTTVGLGQQHSPCERSPDGAEHEGIAPTALRPRGWSLHVKACHRGQPFIIGAELVDAACTCGVPS